MLAVASGAKAHTMSGLAGMGDLMLTCMGGASRNKAVGMRIGKGESLTSILDTRKQSLAGVAEGVATTPAAVKLARKHGVPTPVVEAVSLVLEEKVGAREAISALMQQPMHRDFSAIAPEQEEQRRSKRCSPLGLSNSALAAVAAAEAIALACIAVWALRR